MDTDRDGLAALPFQRWWSSGETPTTGGKQILHSTLREGQGDALRICTLGSHTSVPGCHGASALGACFWRHGGARERQPARTARPLRSL